MKSSNAPAPSAFSQLQRGCSFGQLLLQTPKIRSPVCQCSDVCACFASFRGGTCFSGAAFSIGGPPHRSAPVLFVGPPRDLYLPPFCSFFWPKHDAISARFLFSSTCVQATHELCPFLLGVWNASQGPRVVDFDRSTACPWLLRPGWVHERPLSLPCAVADDTRPLAGLAQQHRRMGALVCGAGRSLTLTPSGTAAQSPWKGATAHQVPTHAPNTPHARPAPHAHKPSRLRVLVVQNKQGTTNQPTHPDEGRALTHH